MFGANQHSNIIFSAGHGCYVEDGLSFTEWPQKKSFVKFIEPSSTTGSGGIKFGLPNQRLLKSDGNDFFSDVKFQSNGIKLAPGQDILDSNGESIHQGVKFQPTGIKLGSNQDIFDSNDKPIHQGVTFQSTGIKLGPNQDIYNSQGQPIHQGVTFQSTGIKLGPNQDILDSNNNPIHQGVKFQPTGIKLGPNQDIFDSNNKPIHQGVTFQSNGIKLGPNQDIYNSQGQSIHQGVTFQSTGIKLGVNQDIYNSQGQSIHRGVKFESNGIYLGSGQKVFNSDGSVYPVPNQDPIFNKITFGGNGALNPAMFRFSDNRGLLFSQKISTDYEGDSFVSVEKNGCHIVSKNTSNSGDSQIYVYNDPNDGVILRCKTKTFRVTQNGSQLIGPSNFHGPLYIGEQSQDYKPSPLNHYEAFSQEIAFGLSTSEMVHPIGNKTWKSSAYYVRIGQLVTITFPPISIPLVETHSSLLEDEFIGTDTSPLFLSSFTPNIIPGRLKSKLLPVVSNSVMRKKQPGWECVMDKDEIPNTNIKYTYIGREDDLNIAWATLQNNFNSFKVQDRTKQHYSCVLAHGALGIGKSRFGYESYQSRKKLTHFLPQIFNCASIYIDFSLGDLLPDFGNFQHDSVCIGLTVASHFFFRKNVNSFAPFISNNELPSFTLENVIKEIGRRYPNTVLLIQLDEFVYLAKQNQTRMQNFLGLIGEIMIQKQMFGVCILPYLIGTTTDIGLATIIHSKLTKPEVLLKPLTDANMEELVNSILLVEISSSDLFKQCLNSLGGIPRFLEYFVKHINEISITNDLSVYFGNFIRSTVYSIREKYGVSVWEGIFNSDPHKPYQSLKKLICLYLTGQYIQLTDSINGITFEQARSSGILILRPSDTMERLYRIHIPFVLLMVINTFTQTVSEKVLDFCSYQTQVDDGSEFEIQMNALRVLRQNIHVSLEKNCVKFSDLYPYSIGCISSPNSGSHSMHLSPINSIPIRNSSKVTIDGSKGEYLVVNVPKSNDSFIGYDDENKTRELIHYKYSSSELDFGKSTTQVSIWNEYLKVTNEEHKAFYGENSYPIFFIITTRPLKFHQEIKVAFAKDKLEFTAQIRTKRTIPNNIIIVSKDEFKNYAQCFADIRPP
eukprot:gene2649-3289_t